jgi:hypothetical protein
MSIGAIIEKYSYGCQKNRLITKGSIAGFPLLGLLLHKNEAKIPFTGVLCNTTET